MRDNIVRKKSYLFIVSLYPLYKKLKGKREYTIADQLWRSGTSIGANIEEAVAASSRSDFSYKLTIALKEARETYYWLQLLRDIHLLENVDPYLSELNSIIALLTSTTKTLILNNKRHS